MKVLLNAEAFGFGPSACIASMFPLLNKCQRINQLDYVGSGHSLDLQYKLPYNNIFNLSGESQFKALVVNYDVFITALDFEKASWAHEVGVKTVIYDTLLWYWRKIPEIIHNCHSYLVQDFYGVRERVAQLELKNHHFIPALVKSVPQSSVKKDLILINFGGLENPHWGIEITASYIRKVLSCILPLLNGQRVKVVCSKAHFSFLGDYVVENCGYEQMQKYLQETKFLIATPGLGNLYEAASYNLPSLFLPPANDSQGQQLMILKEKALIDNAVDWSDIGLVIDYKDKQLNVLNVIADCIKNVSDSLMCTALKKGLEGSKTNQLINGILTFGVDGHEILSKKLTLILKE